jgi:hypothetical protein
MCRHGAIWVVTTCLSAIFVFGCCCHEEAYPKYYPYRDCDSRPTVQQWACHRDVIDEYLASKEKMQDLRGVSRSRRYFEAVTGVYAKLTITGCGRVLERGAMKEAQEAWEAWYRNHDGEVPVVWWDDEAYRYRRQSPDP